MCLYIPVQHGCGHRGPDHVLPCSPTLEVMHQNTNNPPTPSPTVTPDDPALALSFFPFPPCPATVWALPRDAPLKCPSCHGAWVAWVMVGWAAEWDGLMAAARERARATGAEDEEAVLAGVLAAARARKHAELRAVLADLEASTAETRGDVYYALPRWVGEQMGLVRAKMRREGWL